MRSQRPPFQVRRCGDHSPTCWLVRKWDGVEYVLFMHLTARFRYAIDVVDRAYDRERSRR